MPDSIGLPLLRREGQLSAQSYSEADNAVDVVWTTGATVRRRNFSLFDGAEEFDEELVVSANAVRLDRLNSGAPFLDTHGQWSLDSVIGSVVDGSARIAGSQGLARVKLSRAPEHAGIVRNIIDGVIRNVSVGYRIHAVERVEKDGKIPLVRVTDWEPYELSAVPIGADAGAGIRSADADRFPVAINEISAGAAGAKTGPWPALHATRMRMRQAALGRLIHL